MTHVTVRNGLTLALYMGVFNTGLALVESFGLTLSKPQDLALTSFVNAAALLIARVMHMPERTTNGTIQVEHRPVLVETPTSPVTVVPVPPVVAPVPPETPPMPAPSP